MKALDKNRDRRYDSAGNLAEDISRFLRDESVLARPASAGYQLRRFMRKHRGMASTAAGLVAMMIAATVASSYFAYQTNLAVEEARLSAKRSDEVLSIVTRSFYTARPTSGPRTNMLAKDVLLNARKSVDVSELDFGGRMKLLNSVAESFRGIGDYGSAVSVWQELYTLCKEKLGLEHPATLQKVNNLAVGYAKVGRQNDAIQLLEKAMPHFVAIHGPEHMATLGASQNLAACYNEIGNAEKAIELQQGTLKLMRNSLGDRDQATLQAMNNLGNSLVAAGKPFEAKEILFDAVELMTEEFGDQHAITIQTKGSLAICLGHTNAIQEAIDMLSDVVGSMAEVFW